jgi:CheY-like chemotaxis protein
VAMTGFSENTHREEAVEAGFDAYLVKPVSRNKLAATLAEVTSRSEQSSGG